MREFISKVGIDVARTQMFTEYDLALFAEVNRRYLAAAVAENKTPLRDLAERAGFEVLSVGHSYYGHCDFLVLKKP